ncbi:SAM-dependent methyltransferase [Pseudonocardia sp.]|uniref:SAM-dependent methyltransferase n=1 Tax=Pseudonocardia sp. TaxID=60912 RepID=UPI003D0997FC
MGFDDLVGTTQRLNVSVEALAALTAELRVRAEGLEPAPEVRAALADVVAALGVGDLDDLAPAQLGPVVGFSRAFFRQAQELVEGPDRPPGWEPDDPALLSSQGRASMLVADLLAQVSPGLGNLAARLRAPGAAVLDVGTGVGLLAVALCRTFPCLHVVGIDLWPRVLELAAANVAEAGLRERVVLRAQGVQDLADRDAYDAVWLPGPFLPRAVVPSALAATLCALRPGGWVVFGLYAAAADALARAVTDLRIIRSGGHPWAPDEAAALLRSAGFADVRAVERTWNAPIGFVAGRRP